MTKSNGEMWLALGLLAISIGILGYGTTINRNEAQGMTLCTSKMGDIGYVSGIITNVRKERSKLTVSLTEGTQGCDSRLFAHISQFKNLTSGNRIKVKVKTIDEGMYELKGEAEIDPTVVDTEGNTETPISVKAYITDPPHFYIDKTYADLPVYTEVKMLHLKVDQNIINQIQFNKPVIVYYYETTSVVTGIEYP